MLRIFIIAISVIVLLAIYKMQHVKPVDDPKDSPIFQQRLQSSLERFQKNELSEGQEGRQTPRRPDKMFPSSRPRARTRDLVVSGMCGKVTITWVEEQKIGKENVTIQRRAQGKEYSLLADKRVFEREEEGGGVRYWATDSGLTDGVNYEYRISFKDPEGKDAVKEPVSINLTCTEQDKEIVAQREKRIKEYYQKQGIDPKKYAAPLPSKPTSPPARTRGVVVSGRCSRVTLTWVEEQKIDQEKITVKRKDGEGDYVPLVGKQIYEREEEGGGVRYWLSDNGLADGETYEYLVSFPDSQGKESVKKPVSINLTCTERDREIVAQRDKMIKEYYEQRGIKPQNVDSAKPPSYTLSEEVHQVDLRGSPRKGKEDAPVTLVVFTDFECVYCSTWSETLDTMLQTFPDDIKIVYKNFPLSYHKQARLAAAAALAAGEQGKFWEMHNLLYRNRTALTRKDILGYAKELKLDSVKFKNTLESEEILRLIDQDKLQGQALGVGNIPTTFINGRSLTGSPPPSYIKGVIEEILENK
jgi:protein-disulfide isomerase